MGLNLLGERLLTHRVTYFLLFLLVNSVLSYSPLGFEWKLWVGLFGILLPLVFAMTGSGLVPREKGLPWDRESFGGLPVQAWIFLGVAFGAVRFLQVAVLPVWPVPDEGTFALLSVEQAEGGPWRLFYTSSQSTPLFNWMMGLYFLGVPPSLVAMKLFPALFLALTVCALFLFGGSIGSGPVRFLSIFFMAFSFCPLFAESFCMGMTLALFWEVLTLLFLAKYLEDRAGAGRGWAAIILGSLCGSGFFVSVAWVLVVAMVLLAVLASRKGRAGSGIGGVLFPAFLGAALFAWASLEGKNGIHAMDLLVFRSGVDPARQIIDSLSNLTGIFWGGDFDGLYGPCWGGLLNPVLGSFFLMGLLELVRHRERGRARWVLACLFLCLLPGLVTVSREIFRNLQLFPFLLWTAALGANALVLDWSPRRRKVFLVAVLALSVGLDLVHLVKSHHRPAATVESRIYPEAYRILKAKAARGSGALLFDTRLHVADETLSLACHPFDAVRNPRLAPDQAAWVAILFDGNLLGFLRDRYPSGEWSRLSVAPDAGGDMILGIIPRSAFKPGEFERWVLADKGFRSMIWDTANDVKAGAGFLERRLLEASALANGDPFLGSLYWRMVYDHHNWEAVFGDRDKNRRLMAALGAMENAVRWGYPDAWAFNELGSLWLILRERDKARLAFRRAVECEVDLTTARRSLTALERPGASPGR